MAAKRKSGFRINLNDVTFEELLKNQLEGQNLSHQQLKARVVRASLPQLQMPAVLAKDVPIYKLDSHIDRLVVNCQDGISSDFFAQGELIGRFYQSNDLKFLSGCCFVGQFQGMFQWPSPEEDSSLVFFEGKIHSMQLITHQDQESQDENINLVSQYESSFHGYFKGRFFPWSIVGGLTNIITGRLLYQNSRQVPTNFHQIKDKNWNNVASQEVEHIRKKIEYILPVMVRFQVKNFGDIALDKSKAVVNGNLYFQIKYNDAVDGLIQEEIMRGKELVIHINFNRDFTLKLPLSNQEFQSEDSEWSIQDKTWDIEFTKLQDSKIYHYKVLKRFRAEIDNSYGAFFAPFNLSRLKIVVSLSPLYFPRHNIKVSFSCTDTMDYHPQGPYNPFLPIDKLGDESGHPSPQQINRFHKINRHWCSDSGQYGIADNMMTIYPHYKVILLNKSFINQDPMWDLGLRDIRPLFEPPLANDLFAAFHYLKSSQKGPQNQEHQFFTFSFLRWNHAIIQIPIYKYVVIDMIKIFVPLTIFTVISLFIFHQENGLTTSQGFTTLAYRLINIASIVLVYVALIPVIRGSLPPMPGITLIEIITYLETLPSILAIINSMLYYTITRAQWQATYKIFHDRLFLFAFALSLFNLATFLTVLIVYWTFKYSCGWSIDTYDESLVKWRSPYYIKFMQSIKVHKRNYYTITEEE